MGGGLLHSLSSQSSTNAGTVALTCGHQASYMDFLLQSLIAASLDETENVQDAWLLVTFLTSQALKSWL